MSNDSVSDAARAARKPRQENEIVARKPRSGDEIDLSIERLDARGCGRAHLDGLEFTVRHALPGDTVRARVLKRQRGRVRAHALAVVAPSPLRVPARCAHFGTCGGCSFQDLGYAAQLDQLHALVVDAFAAHELRVPIEAVQPASELYGYRNKMEFTFSNRRWIEPGEPAGVDASFALGLHAAERFQKVIDIGACSIQHPVANEILASARGFARGAGLAPWDVRAHTGLLRYLMVRVAHTTSEVLVNLVTSSDSPAEIDPYLRRLCERHTEITTCVQNVNAKLASTSMGQSERVHHGPGVIHEELCGVRFAISANSFFQTNTRQAERLFEMVREEAALTGRETVLDLYCGTGSLGLVLASRAARVIGMEQVPEAIADARRNAAQNGIAHAEFHAGDVLELLRAGEVPRADVLVVDPPRAGLHPRVLPLLAATGARRIVYVSCNPESGARDAAELARQGYRLSRVRPIDLFPHTPHVESVLRLDRADPDTIEVARATN